MIQTRRWFEQLGKALYGANWRSMMATRLGVTKRTIERYLSGDRRLPRNIAQELEPLVDEQISVLNDLIGRRRTDQKMHSRSERTLTETK